MSEEKLYQVKCRVLVEGYIDVAAEGPRSARKKALGLLSGGIEVLDDIQEKAVIGHDAQEKKAIVETPNGDPIATRKRKV